MQILNLVEKLHKLALKQQAQVMLLNKSGGTYGISTPIIEIWAEVTDDNNSKQ